MYHSVISLFFPRLFLCVLFACAGIARGDGASDCAKAAGTYRSGRVASVPMYVPGASVNGVELSHTRLSMLADQDGKTYDVAIDNIFADGYDVHQRKIPAPLDSIVINDRLEVCGELYTSGVGIHWVHTNCGVAPSAARPDGWTKRYASDGSLSQNLEGNTQFCAIFSHKVADTF